MRCECCGHKGRLLEHHWFQPPSYIKRIKKVCKKCNNLLVLITSGLLIGSSITFYPTGGNKKSTFVDVRSTTNGMNSLKQERELNMDTTLGLYF